MKCKSCNKAKLNNTGLRFFSYCPQCNIVYDKYGWIFKTSFYLFVWMIAFAVIGIVLSILPSIIKELYFGIPNKMQYIVFNEYLNNHQIEVSIIQKITMILFSLWIILFCIWFFGNFIYGYLKDKEKKKKDVVAYIKLKHISLRNASSLYNEIKLSFIISLIMFIIYIGISIVLVGNAYI